jgi:hypothetical protein
MYIESKHERIKGQNRSILEQCLFHDQIGLIIVKHISYNTSDILPALKYQFFRRKLKRTMDVPSLHTYSLLSLALITVYYLLIP